MDTSTFWSDHFSSAVINNLRDIVNGSGSGGSGIIDNQTTPTNSGPLPVPDGTPSYIVPVNPTITDATGTKKKITQDLPLYDFFNQEYFTWSLIAIVGGTLFSIAMFGCLLW